MEYVKIQNNKIIGHFCGGKLPKKEKGITVLEVPSSFAGLVGDDLNLYHDTKLWKRKTLKEQIDEGIIEIPKGKKLSQNEQYFEDKTDEEKILDGRMQNIPELYLI